MHDRNEVRAGPEALPYRQARLRTKWIAQLASAKPAGIICAQRDFPDIASYPPAHATKARFRRLAASVVWGVWPAIVEGMAGPTWHESRQAMRPPR